MKFFEHHFRRCYAAYSVHLRLQMLRPAGVKLTSVDALRVIGAFEEAIKRSELMACIEDAIYGTVGAGPLCTALGTDIVAELEEYKVCMFVLFPTFSSNAYNETIFHLCLRDT
jgi:hypothetical protein